MSEFLQNLILGASIGFFPSLCMLITSLFSSIINQPSPEFEANTQNFCAGMILAAVARELFPLIDLSKSSLQQSIYGISFGFFIGLFFVHFLDFAVDYVSKQIEVLRVSLVSRNSFDVENISLLKTKESELTTIKSSINNNSVADLKSYQSIDSTTPFENSSKSNYSIEDASDEDDPESNKVVITLATQATSSLAHRKRIEERVTQLVTFICTLEEQATGLIAGGKTLSALDLEIRADQIDESIHKLQYGVDNCKRLIQGTGSNIVSALPRLWISEDGKRNLQEAINSLKSNSIDLTNQFSTDEYFQEQSIIDILNLLDRLDENIQVVHHTVDGFSFKWSNKGRRNSIPVPIEGSYIPMSLMVPVCVDSIVDGFLMGSSAVMSQRAGIILSLANAVEMGFLGLAVSIRISKCTASSVFARYVAVITPPLLMFTAAILGATIGTFIKDHKTLFFGLISFGIVALLYLVVNELLVSAREAQAGQEHWWSAMVLFLGVYTVLLLELVVPN
eukprot:gene7931-10764_t